MKRNTKILSLLLILLGSIVPCQASKPVADNRIAELPDSIFSGLQGKHHVQGIAVDMKREKVFFSFTTRLVVTDFQGNLLGSVDGLTGHLGCLSFDEDNNRLYGSIEYKNDEIGRGIAGEEAANWRSKFYIAVFNPDEIMEKEMPAEKVMKTIELREVAEDYHAVVYHKGEKVEHRYGCSGIDGVALAPPPGKRSGKKLLYVAYGIYGDTTRSDNDYQVINCYDIESWKRLGKYFVYTGNTTFGIQNLCYNPIDNSLLAAVYKGSKKDFPNYTLFAVDLDRKPRKEKLKGFDPDEMGMVLPLASKGESDEKTGIRGWHFPLGSTGICHVAGNLFYISHNSSQPQQSSTLRLYRWTGSLPVPFTRISHQP